MKTASEFRKSGYESLRGKWGIAILASLIASAIGGGSAPSGGISFNFSFSEQTDPGTSTPLPDLFESVDPVVVPIIYAIIITVAFAIIAVGIAIGLVGTIITTGHAKFNLDINDGNMPSLVSLFRHFPDWKRIIGANVIAALRILGGLLLFIVPGIIASYNYIALPYVLAENKDLTAREAVERSKDIMYGNRWRFFCMRFSFIGWQLLTLLTLGVLGIWLNPYISATDADFYREITNTRPEVYFYDASADGTDACSP